MRNLILVLAAVVALVLTQGVAGASAIVNGGFETGDFFGWTQGGNLTHTSVVSGTSTESGFSYVNGGTYAAMLGPVTTDGTLSQDITTVVGNTYQVTFWLANAVDDIGNFSIDERPNVFSLLINNANSISVPNDRYAVPYQEYIYSFAATTATTTVQFKYHQNPDFWYLDDVSVNDTTVPEPATFVLIGAGLIGLALIGRRRRA